MGSRSGDVSEMPLKYIGDSALPIGAFDSSNSTATRSCHGSRIQEVSVSNTTEAATNQFVADLQMPTLMRSTATAGKTPEQEDHKQSASVAGNALLAFTANVSAQHKDDLLNSIGLAQLAAAVAKPKPFDASKDPMGYYGYVTGVLKNIGYTAQSIDFSSYAFTTKTVEIDKIVLEVMASLVAGPELAVVKSALAALKAAADSGGPTWKIYSSKSSSTNNGAFSIGLANETNNNVAVQLSAFHFQASEHSTQFLWSSYSATSIKLKDGRSSLVLNDSVYSGVRATVLGKMSGHAQGYIDNLPPLG
jgi:hypothetical protein